MAKIGPNREMEGNVFRTGGEVYGGGGGGEEPQATWKNRKIEMTPSKHSMLRERVKAQGKGGATAGECAIDREFMLM